MSMVGPCPCLCETGTRSLEFVLCRLFLTRLLHESEVTLSLRRGLWKYGMFGPSWRLVELCFNQLRAPCITWRVGQPHFHRHVVCISGFKVSCNQSSLVNLDQQAIAYLDLVFDVYVPLINRIIIPLLDGLKAMLLL